MTFQAPPAFAAWAIALGVALRCWRAARRPSTATDRSTSLGFRNRSARVFGIEYTGTSPRRLPDVQCPVADTVSEAGHTQRWIGLHGRPIAAPDRYPDAPRHLIGQSVEGERRHPSDHAFWRKHDRFSEDLVLFDFHVTLLLNAARDTVDFTALDGARDRLSADAGLAQFMCMHHAARSEQASKFCSLRALH